MGALRTVAGWAAVLITVIAPHVAGPSGAAGATTRTHGFGSGSYQAIRLGTLGGRSSLGSGLNDLGQVVGWSEAADGRIRPFIWQDGRMAGLRPLTPGLDNWSDGTATAINNRGDVVGHSFVADGVHAVMWRAGRVIDLGTLGTAAYATAVDDKGRVAGMSDHTDGGEHAFLWRRGTMTDLGTSVRFTVFDMNDRAWLVGSILPAPETPVAVVWRRGDVVRIDGPGSGATAVNDRGQVVGSTSTGPDGGPRATLWQYPWRPGTATDLGVLPGDRTSLAVDVNDRGQVLGWSDDLRGQRRSVLWWLGGMTDLSIRGVPVDGEPIALNDRGDILVNLAGPEGPQAVLFRRP